MISKIIQTILNWIRSRRLKELEEQLSKAESKIRSLFVLHGHAVEKLAPFSDKFKGDMKEITFLGNPLDYIGFHDNEIVFYEIKSGVSKLSPKQERIKKLIEDKKITFKLLRY